MNYTSLEFLLFLAVSILAYFLFPVKKYRWTILLAASYFFYLFAGWRLVGFLLFTTLSTYGTGLWLDHTAKKSKAIIKEKKTEWSREEKKKFKDRVKVRKRLIMAAALVVNFGILSFLKYWNFLAGSFNALFSFGQGSGLPILHLLLPLGISFYTFQSMGYVIDVYREEVPAERNPAKLALFVSFFPQIIQGPISLYSQLSHQLIEPHDFSFTRMQHGLELILWGFFKKVVIADRAVIAIQAVTPDYKEFGGTTLLFILLLYALQLYADFSGGIDISRGVAQILGIDLVDNFRRPYFSTSINDYWRRWHITLGGWLKNYLFYPLAMSECFLGISRRMKETRLGKTAAGAHIAKVLPTSVASLIVFLVVGIWHGANWKYVAFGLWNGGIIMLSTLLKPLFDWTLAKLHIRASSFGFRLFQMLRTFLIVLVGYVFDIAPGFRGGMDMMGRMLTDQNFAAGWTEIRALGLAKADYLLLLLGTLVLFTVSLLQERLAQKGQGEETLRSRLDKKPMVLRWGLQFAGIMAVLVLGVWGPGYDPADFVYMQF